MTTITASAAAAKNCSRVCERQSASAVAVRVAAMITIGKWLSVRVAPIRSSSVTLLTNKPPDRLPPPSSALERDWRNVLADQLWIMRIACDHRAIVDAPSRSWCRCSAEPTDEVLEMGGLHAAAGEADELAVAVDDLAGEHGGPHAGYLASTGSTITSGVGWPEVNSRK